LAAAGILAGAAISATATGATARPLRVRLSVSVEGLPGALNRITATVSSAPGARCRLSVSEPGRKRAFSSRRRGSVGWRWISSVGGNKGPWSFRATCRAGSRWAWWQYRPEPGLPRIGGAFVSAPGIAGAEPSTPIAPGPGSCDEQGICFAADPFPVGQCTWYALGRRPDLAGIVEGDASRWLEAAAGKAPEGPPTGPRVGALAVWAPNVGPAGPLGHVAYVAAVHGPQLLIDDSNWTPTPQSPLLEVHEHWVPAASVEGDIYPPAAPADTRAAAPTG
jgi:surface antigen